MKTEEITLLPITVFEGANEYFWMDDLKQLPEKYRFLELPNRRKFYILLFVERAQGAAIVDGAVIRLEHPKVICIKPGSIFSLESNGAAVGKIVCFTEDFFSIRYNNNMLSSFSFLGKEYGCDIRLDNLKAGEWKLLLACMQDEFREHGKGVESVLRSFLNILLCRLDREFDTGFMPAKKNTQEEKVKQFKLLLEEHFVTQKTPSFYAGMLNVTTNYLNKLCRKYEGFSSGELVRRRVTLEAQRMLHYTVLPVADIARKLEFESVSYFITFFKKNTGVTPENFRKTR
jgi:AraC-like DNA-binding protein